MGGNLFKLGRMQKEAYLALEAELRERLEELYPDRYRIPRFIREKPDFGDADILLSDALITTDWPALRQELIAAFAVRDHRSQPRLLSTDYRGFQVDFFLIPEAELDAAWHFLCDNDLGNILGKLFRRLGLKYGMDGLSYVFRRTRGSYRRDILLSRDWRRILAFIGLDYRRWLQGFDTYQDMFDWVIAGPFFTADPFLDPSIRTRARERRRGTMKRFIDYLEAKAIIKTHAFEKDRARYLPQIAAAFPEAGLLEEVERERAREQTADALRAKLNGRRVMALFPELEGKALGMFMSAFKEQLPDFERRILAMSDNQIDEALRDFHRRRRQGDRSDEDLVS